MFRGAESVVKNLTALGKSLILALTISASAVADDVLNPRFFEYSSNNIANKIVEFSFGWNKKLNENQRMAYHQSIHHALNYAENGDKVKWYRDKASGFAVPVMTWPRGNGYCRRLHMDVVAFNVRKTMSVTACHNSSSNSWTWYRDK